MLHTHILNKEQKELLPFIKKFSKDFFLVGGTAIALQIGHRMSVDFDLFSNKKLKRRTIKKLIEESNFNYGKIIFEAEEQMHIPINTVKVTFFWYPHVIPHPQWFEKNISMPALLDLAAMKAAALGGRAKWRDYVDLYFILKHHHSIMEITDRANELFKEFFNVRLFKEQLSYFTDIDYSEPVNLLGNNIPENEIKKYLTDISLTSF